MANAWLVFLGVCGVLLLAFVGSLRAESRQGHVWAEAGSVRRGGALPVREVEAEYPWLLWWQGKQASGDWLGMRTAAANHGFSVQARWRGVYFGVLSSESGSGNAFTQEGAVAARWDFGKLLKNKMWDGWAAFGEARWRESAAEALPNTMVEASRPFNPSRYAGGVGWRLLNFGLTYETPEMFGVKDFLTVTGGWLQPQREFIEQSQARLFVNNAVASAEAIGANIPFGSSFSTWGATLQVKPRDWHYTKLGIFMNYPNPTDPGNNGLMFQGLPPENGVFALAETGFTPDSGPAKLHGRYAIGAYYYGQENVADASSLSGVYMQADQMIFREPSLNGEKLSEEGLYFFSLFTTAPENTNRYPFYFQSGLVYEGLIPSRDDDQILFAVAYGKYSTSTLPGRTTTTFVEAGYRIRVNGWSFVQPFAQYIVQPNGTPSVANAALLGLFLGVDF